MFKHGINNLGELNSFPGAPKDIRIAARFIVLGVISLLESARKGLQFLVGRSVPRGGHKHSVLYGALTCRGPSPSPSSCLEWFHREATVQNLVL